MAIEGLPASYAPGARYDLTVILEADETSVAGFELAARFGTGEARGRSAGALAPLGARVTVSDSSGISYVRQTADGSVPAASDRATWTFVWTAPGAGGGPVTFNVAANSGNGDNSPLSDLVYTTEATVPPEG